MNRKGQVATAIKFGFYALVILLILGALAGFSFTTIPPYAWVAVAAIALVVIIGGQK